ncbi:MAG: bifunctional folylpolyglutamate synthase/dihydrofolate synthase [Treponema sp.]|nr:bifunctional folylpolyglutamate synthase/dihydrofolate synthase [Treponema sp.]
MPQLPSIQKLESWIDSYLNFEKTPEKNIFWLDTMKYFCKKFGHPENFAPCFHVAGSKGKGSVSKFIASILDKAGFKTGLYTSPHILNFIERVSGAQEPFEDEVYERAVQEIMNGVKSIKTEDLPQGRPVTWFELVTLFSFLVFRQAKVDYSVFEVGLGGRLDSTNVITPKISVITPIELEHTEFLGDTLEKIAFEKGGIIKNNTPVVIARQKPEVRKVFEKIAEEKQSKAIFLDDEVKNLNFRIKNISNCIHFYTDKPKNGNYIDYNCIKNNTTSEFASFFSLMDVSFSSKLFSRPLNFSLRMAGSFQAENAALAAIAVKTVLPQISEEIIEQGLSKARLPGRFEIIPFPQNYKNLPCLILDGAHTVNSVKFTMETMSHVFEGSDNFTLLFACAADKDCYDIAPLFKDKFRTVFLTKPGNVKQSDLTKLENAFKETGIFYDLNEDFEKQIKKAFDYANASNSILLVTGSFYLIAEVKKFMGKNK